MRALGLLFVVCAALGACGKKQPAKAPQPPADTKSVAPDPNAPAPASEPMERKGDPCEGGEKPH